MEGKRTRGRQKIEMKKISNPDDLLISFSKRRSGIYKKASELVTLCGAEVAVVVFSPTGKAFSYGHPSVADVLNKFMGDVPPPPLRLDPATFSILEAHRRRRMAELNERHEGLYDDLDAERARGKRLQSTGAGQGPAAWWEAPLDGLAAHELHERKRALADLHATLSGHIKARPGGGAATATPPFLGGAGAGTSTAGSTTSSTGFPNGYQYLFGGYGNYN